MASKNVQRGRGRPPVDTERVALRLDRAVLDSLDAFIAGQSDDPSRPEAIRRLLKDNLIRLGHLPPDG